jgi:hypothetical protein
VYGGVWKARLYLFGAGGGEMIPQCYTHDVPLDESWNCPFCTEIVNRVRRGGGAHDSTKPVGEAGGTKHDNGKPDLSLLPFKALEDVARVMMFGANKYGRGNYKQGLQVTRLLAAAIRHIGAFAEREDKDPESGLPHVAHAVTNLLFIMYMLENKPAMDDRDEN